MISEKTPGACTWCKLGRASLRAIRLARPADAGCAGLKRHALLLSVFPEPGKVRQIGQRFFQRDVSGMPFEKK